MKHGFYVPNFGPFGQARLLAELAHEAEEAGWDGFFVWDHLLFQEPLAETWTTLAAIAMRTRAIRIGPLVTPLPRRHIGKLAREVITLDHLSGGRLILGLGAGFPYLPDFAAFGDVTDAKVRAAKLDEGLEVLVSLLSGEPVSHEGAHYRVTCPALQRPAQTPRPPIWIAAAWPAKAPLRRAARWDGALPVLQTGLEVTPEDLAMAAAEIAGLREGGAFDLVRFGSTQSAGDTDEVGRCAEAGATWWIEYTYARDGSLEAARRRIAAGPPRI